jgi:head-tail adaptor
MKSGSMRERLTFYELTETQSPSGAIKKTWTAVYNCRGFFKRSSPVYDKDGVEAKELYRGETIFMIVRQTSSINQFQRVGYKNFMYEIILISPIHADRTLEIQLRKINE